MASATRRKQSGRSLFVEGASEPLADLKLNYAEPSDEERQDGPVGDSRWGSSSDSVREVDTDRLTLSPDQAIFSAVCNAAFWAEVDIVTRFIATARARTKKRGAKHKSTVADLLAYREIEREQEGFSMLDRTLHPDPHGGDIRAVGTIWDRLRRMLALAWPDHPERRLSPEPPDRCRYYRFRVTYLTDELLKKVGAKLTAKCVEAAFEMGLFDPAAGSHTNPDKTQLTYGDGKWFSGLYNHSAKKYHDSDTSTFKNHDGSKPKAPGMLAVFNYARSMNPNERLMLTVDIKNHEQHGKVTDGRIATLRILQMREDHPRMRDGHKGHVFDMAISSEDHDMLLDDEVVGISHTRKSGNGRPSARKLGKFDFKIDKTVVTSEELTAIDGAVTVERQDANGDWHAIPLRGGQVRPRWRKRLGRHVVYREWFLPEHPLIQHGLHGAMAILAHNSTDKERDHKPIHSRRTTALRVHPNYDPVMAEKYGLREDSESANNRTQDMFPNGRANLKGRKSLHLKLFSVQHNYLNTALLNFGRRTGACLDHWYGKYLAHSEPEHADSADNVEQSGRDGPLPLAA